MRSKLDLPAPFGPMIARTAPDAARKETPEKTRWPPREQARSRASMARGANLRPVRDVALAEDSLEQLQTLASAGDIHYIPPDRRGRRSSTPI